MQAAVVAQVQPQPKQAVWAVVVLVVQIPLQALLAQVILAAAVVVID